MGDVTAIAWTNHTFNLAFGCMKVSPGCAHCYAETATERYTGPGNWGPNSTRRTFGISYWNKPLRWDRDARATGKQALVFASSMCDVFEDHPTIERERQKLWPLIRITPHLEWQILTKRPERIAENLPRDWGIGYPNVWLGTSIENNDYVWRADHLRALPAKIRFVSYEPALGPLDKLDLAGLDWIIYGGESGPDYRVADVQWARDMRDRCRKARVPFFHKQSSAPHTEMGIELDGKIVREYPKFERPRDLFASA